MADVITHDTQSAEPGEFAQYLQDKTPPAAPVATAVAPPVEPVVPHAVKTVEPFEDPETGELIEKPGRAEKRIKRLWTETQEAKARAARLEAELADLKTAPRAPAAAPVADPAAPMSDAEALTMAAQARIRPKPDRTAIGTTYATYEDYVEDCAVWGGELAAEKRQVRTEATAAERAEQTRQATFADAVRTARADYDDFDDVTHQDLPISQAIWDATVNAPVDLAGHVQYWLGAHPDETRRIAALAPGPALVAMGEVLATVRAERAVKAAPVAPDPKPRSRAPAPLVPAARNGGAPTRSDQIAEAAGDPMDYIRLRNAEKARRV